MTFNVLLATSQSSLNQLFEAYRIGWLGSFTIETLYNLWYYTDTVNNTIVNCRVYYKYTGTYMGYWCNYMDYDTTSGLYIFLEQSNGNEATSNYNGLTQSELAMLTLYYTANISCFLESSKILTNKGYTPIEDLRKGDLVKTLKNDYLPIVLIGKSHIYNSGDLVRLKNRLYILPKQLFPSLTEDLVLTGSHSLLVDGLYKEQIFEMGGSDGRLYKTDDKLRLFTCFEPRAIPYQEEGTFTIYHLALESDNDGINFGIWANGLLVETCSKLILRDFSGMEFIE